jgi:hypothetical protein
MIFYLYVILFLLFYSFKYIFIILLDLRIIFSDLSQQFSALKALFKVINLHYIGKNIIPAFFEENYLMRASQPKSHILRG